MPASEDASDASVRGESGEGWSVEVVDKDGPAALWTHRANHGGSFTRGHVVNADRKSVV